MTQPSPQPDLTPAFRNFQHYTALGFLFAAPILIALPPRKLDLYTFALGSSFILSVNHLLKEPGRQSPIKTVAAASPFGGRQPQPDRTDKGDTKTRYEIVQEQLKREKEDARRRRLLEIPSSGTAQQGGEDEDGKGTHPRPKSAIERGLEKVWMGDEKSGWKERRLAEEQEKISRGEGYGGMIMDQIWEVWNWGKGKGEELQEQDNELLRKRRRREEFPDIGEEKEDS